MNWDIELKRLETVKQNEQTAKRRALVSDEINELQELETDFTNSGAVLDQNKQELAEVTARNSPVIEQLTRRLNDLKTAIKEIDVEMFMQNEVIKGKNLEVVRQQNLCNTLSASKEEGELEFARYMSAFQNLLELKQSLKTEKSKLTNLQNKFHELKLTPDLVELNRRLRELKNEGWNAQERVYSIERTQRDMNSRMMFLRATIAKTEANVAVLA
jgi:chromosome segregation ATPase